MPNTCSLSEAARFAGIPDNKFRAWKTKNKDILRLAEGVRDPLKHGLPARVEISGLMFIWIIGQLVNMSIQLKFAAHAAAHFVHSSDIWLEGDDVASVRQPNELYPSGKTILAISTYFGTKEMAYDILNLPDTVEDWSRHMSFASWFGQLQIRVKARPADSMILIDLNAGMWKCREKLGLGHEGDDYG